MTPTGIVLFSLFSLFLPAITPTSATQAARPDSLDVLEKEVIIHAGLDRVWDAWTTEEGLRFVSPVSNVGLYPGGPYELFLDQPPDDRGRRGSEGSRVLSVFPREVLAFDWTFPPSVPGLRRDDAETQVGIFLTPTECGVRVRLVQQGWQEGPEWEAGYQYFDAAWGAVLQAMKEHLEGERSDDPDAGLRAFLESVPRQLTEEGPSAWLSIMDPSDAFFMATDGALAFDGGEAAAGFVADFAPTVSRMDARFDALRVDSLGCGSASFGASYEEEIHLKDGTVNTYAGYVTGLARRTGSAWRLRQMHWSQRPPEP